MSDDSAIEYVIIFALIPFILVYGNMGVRYMYEPMSTGFRYGFESTKNLTHGTADFFFNVTNFMNQLNQGFQKVEEWVETFFHAEFCVLSSIFRLVQEIYIVLLRIANVYTDGVQNLVFNFLNGIWDVLKELWEFINKVLPEVGWFVSNACRVVLRMVLYFNINRLVIYLCE